MQPAWLQLPGKYPCSLQVSCKYLRHRTWSALMRLLALTSWPMKTRSSSMQRCKARTGAQQPANCQPLFGSWWRPLSVAGLA